MALPPRSVRPLPRSPAELSDEGVRTGLVTRILIVGTIVLGQLWALTAALELRLIGEAGKPWLLAGFSVISYVVVLVLVRLDPPGRAGRRKRSGRW